LDATVVDARGRIAGGDVNAPQIAIAPIERPDIALSVAGAGGEIAPVPAADALIWTGDDPPLLGRLLHPRVRWVQLCASGVDTWIEAGVVDRERTWTAAKGVGAGPMAEHALALMLAAARELPLRLRARSWGPSGGRRLAGTVAGIIGAGGVGSELIRLLGPLGVSSIALTRTGRSIPGATRSIGPQGLGELLRQSDWVVIAAPDTPATRRLIGAAELAAMRPGAWLINVSRGAIVDTDALAAALAAHSIGGAGLDVTDPEPLPDGHPLWRMPNVVITPHVSATAAMNAEALCLRVAENVRRFQEGEALIGVVDLDEGY
jgi:phosphoglycerate dehydrogenase-like enzyme